MRIPRFHVVCTMVKIALEDGPGLEFVNKTKFIQFASKDRHQWNDFFTGKGVLHGEALFDDNEALDFFVE